METYSSNGVNSIIISKDLIIILVKLENKVKLNIELEIKELLFYIDATNGVIFCSGFNIGLKETIDCTMCHFELDALWNNLEDNGYSSIDFDIIAEESIKKAFESEIGKRLKLNYQVLIETEEGDRIEIK
jgi:hypothetical protein